MKAAVLKGPQQMCVVEMDLPACPPGGVLTRVNACAICGSDLRLYDYGPADGITVHGHECVMTVLETGEGVTEPKRGDRILVCPVTCGECAYCQRGMQHLCVNKSKVRTVMQGGFAEYRPIGKEAIQGGFVLKVPDELDDMEATLVEPLSCVINGNQKLGIYPGSTVVIIGAGPIGNLHLQMARMRGASQVILIDVLESRLDMNKESGASHLVNSSVTDPVKAVMEFTSGQGAEVVIVACVSAEAQAQALRMARRGGEVCLFAALPDARPTATLNTNLIHNNELTVIGSRSSSRRHFELAIELIRTRRIDPAPIMTHVLPLDRIQEGFQLAKSGKAMKVVIKP